MRKSPSEGHYRPRFCTFAASFSKERTMTARAVIYATLFTAGLQALAIFATQEHPASGRVLTAHSALGAPKPAPARVDLPVGAPSIVSPPLRAATEPTPITPDAAKPANATRAAMANATRKLTNTPPLYDSMARRYRMARKRQMIRQRRCLATNYARPQSNNSFAT